MTCYYAKFGGSDAMPAIVKSSMENFGYWGPKI